MLKTHNSAIACNEWKFFPPTDNYRVCLSNSFPPPACLFTCLHGACTTTMTIQSNVKVHKNYTGCLWLTCRVFFCSAAAAVASYYTGCFGRPSKRERGDQWKCSETTENRSRRASDGRSRNSGAEKRLRRRDERSSERASECSFVSLVWLRLWVKAKTAQFESNLERKYDAHSTRSTLELMVSFWKLRGPYRDLKRSRG